MEVANLKKSDIQRNENRLKVFVRKGKGGEPGVIKSFEDSYLVNKMESYLADFDDDDFIFPKRQVLINKAGEIGLEMHDLRRIFAIRKKKDALHEGATQEEANEAVRIALRHSRFSVTKRYLFNRKLKFKKGCHAK